MKATRSKKGALSNSESQTSESTPKPTAPKLESSIANPPRLFVLPKDASPNARVITIDQESDRKDTEATPRRYFVCPDKGFYEFTRVTAPKRACRSWLLSPESSAEKTETKTEGDSTDKKSDPEGYVLSSPDFFMATPIDPLFVLLSVTGVLWSAEMPERPEYLDLDDRMRTLKTQAPHLRQMLEEGSSGQLETMLKDRMACCCKALKMGGGSDDGEEEPETLYAPDVAALAAVLLKKAERMVEAGLPASMEERFVRQALDAPVQSIKREETDESVATENKDPEAEEKSGEEKAQDAAKPTEEKKQEDPATQEFARLLRLRTALSYMLKSYVRTNLRAELEKIYANPTGDAVNFEPLDNRLAQIAKMKADAHALRSISDNVSRKRAAPEDEDFLEKQDAKKRKKDEEEMKKKSMSHGVKKLMKADTSGMKKMSSFFTKAPAKKAS